MVVVEGEKFVSKRNVTFYLIPRDSTSTHHHGLVECKGIQQQKLTRFLSGDSISKYLHEFVKSFYRLKNTAMNSDLEKFDVSTSRTYAQHLFKLKKLTINSTTWDLASTYCHMLACWYRRIQQQIVPNILFEKSTSSRNYAIVYTKYFNNKKFADYFWKIQHQNFLICWRNVYLSEKCNKKQYSISWSSIHLQSFINQTCQSYTRSVSIHILMYLLKQVCF